MNDELYGGTYDPSTTTNINDETYGGNYKPMTAEQLNQKYDAGEIDLYTYIKLMKYYKLILV